MKKSCVGMGVAALAAVVLSSSALFSPAAAYAEDLNEIFKRVNELVAQKNYPKAMEELEWAKKEIGKLNASSITSFFPDTLAGFTGQKAEVSNVLGMTNVERVYKSGEKEVRLSLTGGAAGALGGLAGIGKMAAMFGGEAGQDTIRIQGRTAMLRAEEGSPELQLFLDSGSILSLTGSDGVTAAEIKAIAEAIKIDALDNYLRGQGK